MPGNQQHASTESLAAKSFHTRMRRQLAKQRLAAFAIGPAEAASTADSLKHLERRPTIICMYKDCISG